MIEKGEAGERQTYRRERGDVDRHLLSVEGFHNLISKTLLLNKVQRHLFPVSGEVLYVSCEHTELAMVTCLLTSIYTVLCQALHF